MRFGKGGTKPPTEEAARARRLAAAQARWEAAGCKPLDAPTPPAAPPTVPARLQSPPVATPPPAGQERRTGAPSDSRPATPSPRPVQAEPVPAAEPAGASAARVTGLAPDDRPPTPHEHPARAIPLAMRQAMVDAYTAGETVPTIARRAGTTPATVRRVILAAEVPIRDDRAGHSGGTNRIDAYPAELVDQVRSRYESGWSQPQIAAWLCRSRKFVQDVMAKHGIAARDQSAAQSLRPRDAKGRMLPGASQGGSS